MPYTLEAPDAAPAQSKYTLEPPAPQQQATKPAAPPYTLEPPQQQASAYTLEPPSVGQSVAPGIAQAHQDISGGPNIASGAEQSFADIPKEMKKESQQGLQDIKGDFTAPVQSHKLGVAGTPGWKDYAARGLKAAGDVASYATGTDAARGAVRSVLGRPIEKATGSPGAADTATDMAMMVAPFGGDIKAAIQGPSAVRDGMKAVEKLMKKRGP